MLGNVSIPKIPSLLIFEQCAICFLYYLDCAIGKGSISVFHKSNWVSQNYYL